MIDNKLIEDAVFLTIGMVPSRPFLVKKTFIPPANFNLVCHVDKDSILVWLIRPVIDWINYFAII